MKITDIEVIKWNPGTGKNFIYIKLTTDTGISGWGEAYAQAARDTQIEAHIDRLARYLINRDPFHIRHFMHIAHEDFAPKQSAMDLHCALSGIEIAMWDIVGKAVEQPIYNLIGGPVRPHIRVYANGWGQGSPDDIAQEAAKLVEQYPEMVIVPVKSPKYPIPIAWLTPQDDQIWINYLNHWIEIKKAQGFFDQMMDKYNLKSL